MRIEHRIKVPGSLALNANDRRNRWRLAAAVKELRFLGHHHGRDIVKIPGTLCARVDVYVWKRSARRYDPQNLYPLTKALVDGMVDAGVFVDDDHRHVDGPFLHHGGVDPRMRAGTLELVFVIDTDGGAA